MTMSRSCALLSFFVLGACASAHVKPLTGTLALSSDEIRHTKGVGMPSVVKDDGELVSWRCDHPEVTVSLGDSHEIADEVVRFVTVQITGTEPRHIQGFCDIQMERRDLQVPYDVEIGGTPENPGLGA